MFAPLPIKPDINSLLFFCHVLNGNAICRASIQHNPLIKPILTKSESVGNSTICPQIISNVEETLALIFVYFISTIISIKSILKSVSCLSISYKTQLLTVGEIPFNMKLTQSKDIKQTKRLESYGLPPLYQLIFYYNYSKALCVSHGIQDSLANVITAMPFADII
eukprot:1003062_1